MNKHQHGKPTPKEMAVVEALRTRLMPMLYNIEDLQRQMAQNPSAPPDWPVLMSKYTAIISNLNSVFRYVDGDGPDSDNSRAKDIEALHPYPIPPFPIEQPNMAGLASALLRKKLEPGAEDWIIERLAKAKGFCAVPEEWEIPEKKPNDVDVGVDDGEESKVKRRQGRLDEDELAELWNDAGDVFQQSIGKIEAIYEQQANGEDEEGEDEDEEMEDAEAEAAAKAKTGAGAAVKTPVIPLSIVHKFMSTGAITVPAPT